MVLAVGQSIYQSSVLASQQARWSVRGVGGGARWGSADPGHRLHRVS